MSISTSKPPRPGLLRSGNFNLSAATTRSQWQKALEERMPDVDWYAVLEVVCAKAVRRWREGEAIIDLAAVEVPPDLPYILPPVVVEGGPTVIYADGASGKSLLALAMAVSIATGTEVVPGLVPQRLGPVIYWDWEWDAESHAERLQAICAGVDIPVPRGMVYYQREMVSVLDAVPRMRKRVAETGAVAVIVDSLGYARGGDANSQELTIRTFGALRTLERPVIVLDHVSADGKDKDKSFGSIYTRDSARSLWRIDVQKEEGRDDWYAALVNTKANRKYQRTRGLLIRTESDEDERLLAVRFEATDVREMPGVANSLTLREHLVAVLEANRRPLPLEDILACLEAEGRDVSRAVVEVTLRRNRDTFFDGSMGWGLRTSRVDP
jgi:hypothetical protein